mgnify:CR=1 FL=1
MENVDSTRPTALVETLSRKQLAAQRDFLATLRADYDPEVRGDFQHVIRFALNFGIQPDELGDAFAVSQATISRWGRGLVVPGTLIRQEAVRRIETIVESDPTPKFSV